MLDSVRRRRELEQLGPVEVWLLGLADVGPVPGQGGRRGQGSTGREQEGSRRRRRAEPEG